MVQNSIKISQKEFESLDFNTAKSLALSDENVKKHLAGLPVKEVKFDVYPFYEANVNFLVDFPFRKKPVKDVDTV